MTSRTECSCGSGEFPQPQYDGYGIFLTGTCKDCHGEKMGKYRSDIHERYETDERIEEDY